MQGTSLREWENVGMVTRQPNHIVLAVLRMPVLDWMVLARKLMSLRLIFWPSDLVVVASTLSSSFFLFVWPGG